MNFKTWVLGNTITVYIHFNLNVNVRSFINMYLNAKVFVLLQWFCFMHSEIMAGKHTSYYIFIWRLCDGVWRFQFDQLLSIAYVILVTQYAYNRQIGEACDGKALQENLRTLEEAKKACNSNKECIMITQHACNHPTWSICNGIIVPSDDNSCIWLKGIPIEIESSTITHTL